MASNDLTVFDPKTPMPAHVAAFFDSNDSNITERTTVPSLGYEGKVWQISVDGNKTKLMRRNADGDEEPVGVLPVVVLDYAKRRGRAYYEGDYDPNKVSAPLCWSDDGVAPDASVPDHPSEKLANKPDKCENCPMSVKGSKITPQGKAVTACSQHRMLAVVPAHKLDFTPLRLKIAITSDFDKQSPDAEAGGWYAFSNYMDFLQKQGVKHSAMLVTKMKFDQTAAYPKLFFRADRWLTVDEVNAITPVTRSEGVAALLAGTWTPAGADGVKKNETTATPTPEAPVAQTAHQVSEPEDDGDGEIIMSGLDAPPAEPDQGAAQATIAVKPNKQKPEPKPAAEKAAEASPVVSNEVPPEVESLLKAWGDSSE